MSCRASRSRVDDMPFTGRDTHRVTLGLRVITLLSNGARGAPNSPSPQTGMRGRDEKISTGCEV